MSTFCPLCGSAIDDGEVCSCQSQGIKPVILGGVIQEETVNYTAQPVQTINEVQVELSPMPAQQAPVQIEPVQVQQQAAVQIEPVQVQQQAAVQIEPVQVQQQVPVQQVQQQVAVQIEPVQVQQQTPVQQMQMQAQQAPVQQVQVQTQQVPVQQVQVQTQQAPVQQVQVQQAPVSQGVDIGIAKAPVGQGVDIGVAKAPVGQGVDIGMAKAPASQGVDIGMAKAPASQGVDIGMAKAPASQGVDIGMAKAPASQGVDIGMTKAPASQGVDIGMSAAQTPQEPPKKKKDSLQEKYEKQDRMIMEKAGLLPKEEEKEEEEVPQEPVEKYTLNEFFGDLKYDPVDSFIKYVEEGNIINTILFVLAQVLLFGVYIGIFTMRYNKDASLTGSDVMLAMLIGAFLLLVSDVVASFTGVKMLEGSSSEAYMTKLLSVTSVYALIEAPVFLVSVIVALISPLYSVIFAAAAWALGTFTMAFSMEGMTDLDRNRIPMATLAMTGVRIVMVLLMALLISLMIL